MKTPQRGWMTWSLIIGFWTLIGLLFTSQYYFELRGEAASFTISWEKLLSVQFAQWFLWIALSPLILWLGHLVPIERTRLRQGLSFHVPASVFVACLHIAIYSLVIILVKPYPWRMDYGYWSVFLSRVLSLFHFNFIIYWALLGASHAFDYYRKFHEGELRSSNLEAQLVQAQLQALKMQLHPHFLFNTLNAIATQVRKNENKAAIDMLAGLSDLLRLTLDNVGKQEVSLKQELDFLERYLEIEQIRFADRLQVRMKIAPETLDARVPNLILQPLVENAIRHGIAARMNSGLVEISAERDNETLRLQVRDDGPGLPDIRDINSGVGLSNTMARLQHLYGATQRLTFDNAKEGGTVATIEIPFQATKP